MRDGLVTMVGFTARHRFTHRPGYADKRMANLRLESNRRAIVGGMILPALALGISVLVLLSAPSTSVWVRGLAVVVLVASLMGILSLAWLYALPRLEYDGVGYLCVYMRSGRPYRVPIELVEVFFRGQSSSLMGGEEEGAETSTIVVRLAESAEQWKKRDVKRALGAWCDGYITIRGTWCEPIDAELLTRLNSQLVAIHREQRALAQGDPASERPTA